jgi:hypothetical protein
MRKIFLPLVAALIAVGPILWAAAPASAASLTMGCNIQPSANDNFTDPCGTTYAAQSYTVDYYVQGGSGTYTYSWTPPAGKTIVAGCTSTSASCVISTRATQDQQLTGSVVVTQGSTHTDFSALAYLNAVCGTMFC